MGIHPTFTSLPCSSLSLRSLPPCLFLSLPSLSLLPSLPFSSSPSFPPTLPFLLPPPPPPLCTCPPIDSITPDSSPSQSVLRHDSKRFERKLRFLSELAPQTYSIAYSKLEALHKVCTYVRACVCVCVRACVCAYVWCEGVVCVLQSVYLRQFH